MNVQYSTRYLYSRGQDSLLLATSKQNKKKSKEDTDLGDILLSGKNVRVHVPWHLL